MVSGLLVACACACAALLFAAAGVRATFPVCPFSSPDINGHYVYTASPSVWITTAASPNIATQSFTASMWVKPTTQSVTGYAPLIGQGPSGGCGAAGAACTTNLLIGYYFDSISTHYKLVLGAGFDQASNPQQLYDSVQTVAYADSDIGMWQLYVFEYNVLGSFRVWRNAQPLILSAGGQLTSAYTGAAGVIAFGAAGGSPLSNYFVGSMDEMRMWFGVEIPLIDINAMWCDNVVTSAPGFYMNGGDFLSFGSAQTTSTPAPALSGADVTNQCYGYCLVQNATLACASSPCQNGGNCTYPASTFNSTTNVTTTYTGQYICACAAGFSGVNCQTNINECASNPCANGGSCRDGINSFNCSCVAGYAGKRCETDINECASQPCQNDGLCIDLVNGFSCNCTAPAMPECGTCANPTSLPSDLGSQILAPGCYVPTPSTSSFAMTGVLTLSGSGRYQFATTASMSTLANSDVQLTNGADCRRVSWCIVSAVTLGANSHFVGNVKSSGAITVGNTVTVVGSLQSDTTINYGGADTINPCPGSGAGQPTFYGPLCQFSTAPVSSSSGAASSTAAAQPASSSAAAQPASSSAAAAPQPSSSAAAQPASSSAAAAPLSSSAAAASQPASSSAAAAAAQSSSAAAAPQPASSSAAALHSSSAGAAGAVSSTASLPPVVSVSSSTGAGSTSAGVTLNASIVSLIGGVSTVCALLIAAAQL